jgi:hypothetical protein
MAADPNGDIYLSPGYLPDADATDTLRVTLSGKNEHTGLKNVGRIRSDGGIVRIFTTNGVSSVNAKGTSALSSRPINPASIEATEGNVTTRYDDATHQVTRTDGTSTRTVPLRSVTGESTGGGEDGGGSLVTGWEQVPDVATDLDGNSWFLRQGGLILAEIPHMIDLVGLADVAVTPVSRPRLDHLNGGSPGHRQRGEKRRPTPAHRHLNPGG